LDAWLTCRGLALVVLIGRDLRLRVNHGDGDLPGWFCHEILFRVGGEASGNNLHTNGAPSGDDVDRRLALGVCLDLEIALLFAVQSGVEDDGGVADGLAVELLQHRDFNVRGGGRGLIFAAVFDRGILAENSTGRTQTKTEREKQRETDGASATHVAYFTLSQPDVRSSISRVCHLMSYFFRLHLGKGDLAGTAFNLFPSLFLIGERRADVISLLVPAGRCPTENSEAPTRPWT